VFWYGQGVDRYMTKKITLTVNGSRFDIDLEEEFANYLMKQMKKDFNVDGNNELKKLLQAYVRKNHELFLQEQGLEALSSQIDKIKK